MLEQNKIYLGNCLDIMKDIDDKSVNMILADLPYGTTECTFDTVIPFEPLWLQYNRIIKDNGAIVLFGSQPFTTKLINSNMSMFKFEYIWIKTRPTGFGNANYRPMKKHENIIVFSKAGASSNSKPSMTYNPQGLIKKERKVKRTSRGIQGERPNQVDEYISKYTNYPTTILEFASEGKTIHQTQKPELLYKYLEETFSNEGDLILDNVCGSGTIGISKTIKRNFIGIEKDEKMYKIACERQENFKAS